MSTQEFLVLFTCVLCSMLACRVIPLFILKGRVLSDKVQEALGLIPAAAFAALVANDLVQPQTLVQDPIAAALPFVAALPVVLVARRTNSLIWCAFTGMAAYAALLYLPSLLG